MPLYEQWCPKCDELHEMLLSVDSALNQPCPICKQPTERVPSCCSFVMPGFKNGQAVTRTGQPVPKPM